MYNEIQWQALLLCPKLQRWFPLEKGSAKNVHTYVVATGFQLRLLGKLAGGCADEACWQMW